MTYSLCRVCLASDHKMFCIDNIGLRDIFEKISSTMLNTEDGRPLAICYICCSQLRRCQRFAEMSQRAEELFTELVKYKMEISHETAQIFNLKITHELSVTTPQLISFNDHSNNESTPVVKEGFSQVDENSCNVDAIVADVISLEAAQMFNLDLDNLDVTTPQLMSFNHRSNNKSTPLTVKEGFSQVEENSCNVDEIVDDVLSLETSQMFNLDLSETTSQLMSFNHHSNNESTVKEGFSQVEESSYNVDEIEDDVISQETAQMFNLDLDNLDVTTPQLMSFNRHSNNKSTPPAVKEGFSQVEENSCNVDEIVADVISQETAQMFNLDLDNLDVTTPQLMSFNRHSNNKSTPLTVKEGLNQVEGSSCNVDEIVDDVISQETAQMFNLHLLVTTPQLMSFNHHSNNESTPAAVKEGFSLVDENSCNVDDIIDDVLKNIENSQVKENIVANKPINIQARYCCNHCDKMCTSKKSIVRHLKIHTGLKTALRYACSQCNKTFSHKSFLQVHMRIHSGAKPYACSQCDKTFGQKNNLQTHMSVHKGLKPYACKQCDRTFAQKSHLQTHMSIHNGLKPYACSQCDKTFSYKSNLQSHMKIHNILKPYACSQCDKTFARIRYLQSHMIVHTGVKPYPCSQCDKTFAQRSYLHSHMRIHTGVKPYPCSQCDKAFADKSNLRKHVKLHTGVKA